jgi:hypothetical protein
MLRVLLCVFSMLALGSFALTDRKDSCWDETFAYKVASINIAGDNVEFGVGGGFGLFEGLNDNLRDSSGLAVNAGRFQQLFMAFKSSDCTQGVDGTVNCSVATNQAWSPLRNTLFVGRSIQNLGDKQFVVTNVPVDKITVEMSNTGFTANFFELNHDSWGNAIPEKPWQSLGRVEFWLGYCNESGIWGNTHFGTVYFSDELRRFVGNSR